MNRHVFAATAAQSSG